jgi:hypothetical protein
LSFSACSQLSASPGLVSASLSANVRIPQHQPFIDRISEKAQAFEPVVRRAGRRRHIGGGHGNPQGAPASAGAAIDTSNGIAAALRITRAVWPITVILYGVAAEGGRPFRRAQMAGQPYADGNPVTVTRPSPW